MVHTHVDAALGELVKHLSQAPVARLGPSRPSDPCEVVIALVGRTRVIGLTQATFLETGSDVLRHRLDRSCECHAGLLGNGCLGARRTVPERAVTGARSPTWTARQDLVPPHYTALQ